MTDSDSASWDAVIVPRRGLFDLRLGELWRYRDLIALMLRRNLVVAYRQTILGPIWYVVQPLIATVIYTVVFGLIVRVPTDNISLTLFYLSGVVVWSSFSSNVVGTADIFFANMGVFGKVYFPRMSVPIATVIGNLITSALQLACFLVFLTIEVVAGRQAAPGFWILVCPLILVLNGLFAMGVGLTLSALSTQYRDLISMIGAALQLWMYATPIIYPLSQIPAGWRPLVAINPLSTSVEMFRTITLGTGSVSAAQVAISLAIMCGTVMLGLVLFARAEQNAADTV